MRGTKWLAVLAASVAGCQTRSNLIIPDPTTSPAEIVISLNEGVVRRAAVRTVERDTVIEFGETTVVLMGVTGHRGELRPDRLVLIVGEVGIQMNERRLLCHGPGFDFELTAGKDYSGGRVEIDGATGKYRVAP